MRHLFIIAILAFAMLLPVHAAQSSTVDQEEVCYQQCSAYELVWKDDYCWGLFQYMCTMDEEDLGIQMVGAWASYVLSDADFSILVNAYTCVQLVDECISPVLDSCRSYCEYNDLGYAPDLYVSNAHYNPADGYLHVTVRNGGLAYMPGASVAVYGAHGAEAKPEDKDFKLILSTSVPALRPSDVRYSPEGYIHEKEMLFDWQPKEDHYSVAKIVITPLPGYEERSLYNNVFEYVDNDLPYPADVRSTFPEYSRLSPETDHFSISANIYNVGEKPADVAVELYLAHTEDGGEPVYSEVFTLAGGADRDFLGYVEFPSPSPNFIVMRVIADGEVVAEPWIHPDPQFYLIKGDVIDEEGRPIAGATVSDRPFTSSDFPLTSGSGNIVSSDGRGRYEVPYYSTEGPITLYGRKNGFFSNQTTLSITYGDPDSPHFDDLEIIYQDIVLPQHPAEISVGYPQRGAYIIETDKGRFTGPFIPMVAIPVRGNNGTLAIFSENCSPFITEFNISYSGTTLEAPSVTCLSPDRDDDYQLLDSQELLWEKTYPDEVPEMAFFDKRGDHAYVVTIDKGSPLCNLYSYSLPGGEQIYRKALGSYCLQSSAFIPSYDGSEIFVGIGVPKKVGGGINHSTGYIFDESGNTLMAWDYPPMTYNLEHSSATEFLDLRQDKRFSYWETEVDSCMLIESEPCDTGGTRYSIDSLGISGNRVLGSCNGTSCMFTLGHNDYMELPKLATNSFASGNYLNKDVFIGSYKGGYLFHEGEPLWNASGKIEFASMSPGGSYVLVAFDPYKISVFDAQGVEHMPEDTDFASAVGLQATERGLFYATTKGGGLKVYRVSTLAEPESGATEEGSESYFRFVGQFFQVLVDIFNGLVEFFGSMFN